VYDTANVDIPMTLVEDEMLPVPGDENRRVLNYLLRGTGNGLRDVQRQLQDVEQRCYTVAVDALDDFMQNSNAQDKMDYLTELVAFTSVLFSGIQDWTTGDSTLGTSGDRTLQMYMSLGGLRVVETPANQDWYQPSDSCSNSGIISGDCLLTDARTYWEGSGSENWNYHALMTVTSKCGPYGGVAWGNAICSSYRYGISGCLNGSFPRPMVTQSSQTWDLAVFAHEFGHLFGSPHSHDLGIDTCADNCNVPSGGG
jgi:hypothetical protein